ncbi:MAG: glycosyltransferase [Myxococcota bacterium]
MSVALADRGVLAFADVTWNGTWYSRHQILSRLARFYPLAIVGRSVPLRSVPGELFARRPLEAVDRGLWSYRAPAILPEIYRPPALRRLSLALQALHLRRSARGLGFRDPIAYVWNPDFADPVERLDPRTLVYHCYDKYSAYQGAEHTGVDDLEGRIVRRADLVIASSRILAADLEERFGVPAVQLPHGVDFEWFDSLARTGEPADLAAIPRPRIGYIARLDERTDTETLAGIAHARPDWSIVVIGDRAFQSPEHGAAFEALARLPNVHAIGGRPRETIPAYTSGLDVCLLSYRTDNWGRFVQPIKAYEYLACGRPVVSTRIEAVADFDGLVRAADDVDDWVAAIEGGLAESDEAWVERRRAFARANTWDQRVRELVALFESRLGGR